MRGRLGFLIGFGAGYVLGTKAGTERYDQLKRLYDNLVTSQGFRQATGKAKEAASSGIGTAKDKVTEAVKDRRSDEDTRPGGLSVAPPPT
ncbi:MAG: YtxH domain-containing protein [Actinomycetota bacterium]|nr:YtxH domain-containing protein [Actinomycetota bacterium]